MQPKSAYEGTIVFLSQGHSAAQQYLVAQVHDAEWGCESLVVVLFCRKNML